MRLSECVLDGEMGQQPRAVVRDVILQRGESAEVRTFRSDTGKGAQQALSGFIATVGRPCRVDGLDVHCSSMRENDVLPSVCSHVYEQPRSGYPKIDSQRGLSSDGDSTAPSEEGHPHLLYGFSNSNKLTTESNGI